MSKGQYSKSRRRITEPVLVVPSNTVAAPRIAEDLREEVQELAKKTVAQLDKDRYVLSKTMGGLISALIITALSGSAYLGSLYFTREHQLEHLQKQVRELGDQIEVLQGTQSTIEHRLVGLESDIEYLRIPTQSGGDEDDD